MPASYYSNTEKNTFQKKSIGRFSEQQKQEIFKKNQQDVFNGKFTILNSNPRLKDILKPIDFQETTSLEEVFAKRKKLEDVFNLYLQRVQTRNKVMFENLPVLVTSCVPKFEGERILSIKIGLSISFPELMTLRQVWKDSKRTKCSISIKDDEEEIISSCTVEGGEFSQQNFKVILTKSHQS